MPGIDRRHLETFEWPLFSMALALSVIGIVNLVSAAPEQVPGMPPTALRQLFMLGVGLAAMALTLLVDYRVLGRLAGPVFVATVALLIAVLVAGPVIKGAQRWLVLGPLRIQPSELAKLGSVLIVARWLDRNAQQAEMRLSYLLPLALLVAVPVVLILQQPDLGTASLVALIALSVLPVTGVPLRGFVGLAGAGLAAVAGAWLFYLRDYQKERVFTFLDPSRDPLGAAYHAIQSQIAIGSGGLLGKGFGQGSQSQLDFLPEQQTDFVFSVLGEEWGFVGAGLVLLLYLGLLLRGLSIARSSKEPFGSYLALAVVAMLFWPAAINAAMVLGLVPVVGVPLPFLSYGRSALLVSWIGIGLLMNVSMRRYLF
ncbi:MAG: rod shape-determining protein RodA [Myxococcota bacterium]